MLTSPQSAIVFTFFASLVHSGGQGVDVLPQTQPTDQIYLTWSQYTDPGPTSPTADPIWRRMQPCHFPSKAPSALAEYCLSLTKLPYRVITAVRLSVRTPFCLFCVPSYISGVHHSSSAFPSYISGVHLLLLLRSQLYLWGSPSSSSAFPAISLGFTILLLPLRSQLCLWGSPFFFFFCVPSYISGVHHSSSSAFPAISLGFTFFFFCVPSYISGVHHSSSAFPAISLGFTFFFFCVPSYISGVHLLLLLRSQLYLWGSPFFFFFFFFCVPSYISGVHYSSSSSSFAFPAISLGFTILLHLLRSQLYLWGSPFFFFCVPSYISGVHHSSSSSAFPAISLEFTIFLLLLLRSQLYLWGSPFFFFFCVPSYISGVHHSSSFAFPAISLGFTILVEIFAHMTGF